MRQKGKLKLKKKVTSRKSHILYNNGAASPAEKIELPEKVEELFDVEDARNALEEAKKKGSVPLEKLKKDLSL